MVGRYLFIVEIFSKNKVDYDVFVSLYYFFWYGILQNLIFVLKVVFDMYGKKVMVVEILYIYIVEDGDGYENIVLKSGQMLLYLIFV